jgi:hypothetical protein
MRIPPQIRTQDAYNCGLYSLWMALESVSGVDPGLGRKIEDAARRLSDSVGGIFHGLTMCDMIEFLGYRAKQVPFHDVASFVRGLNVYATNAILVAYTFDTRFGGVAAPDDAAQSAHWSTLTQLDAHQTYVRVANPHGVYNWLRVDDLVRSNLQLRGGRFAWKPFVQTVGASAMFNQQAKKYKNSPRELSLRGRQTIHLAGFFIAVQR